MFGSKKEAFTKLFGALRNFVESMGKSFDVFPLQRSNESPAQVLCQFLSDTFVLLSDAGEGFQAFGAVPVFDEADQTLNAGAGLFGD